jgi:hypothetical protein
LRSLAVGFHSSGKILQGSLGLRAMRAVFVPAIRPEDKKNTDSYEDDLEKQMEE